jgi:hypothetical protein
MKMRNWPKLATSKLENGHKLAFLAQLKNLEKNYQVVNGCVSKPKTIYIIYVGGLSNRRIVVLANCLYKLFGGLSVGGLSFGGLS